MKRVTRILTMSVFAAIFMAVMVSLSFAQPQLPIKPKIPVEPKVTIPDDPQKTQKLNLPDLVIIGLRLEGVPPLVRLPARMGPHAGEEWFSATFSYRVENRGPGYAQRFENWLDTNGIGMATGPGGAKDVIPSLGPREGRGGIIPFLFPKEFAGRVVRVRVIADYPNAIIESNEENNSSPWLEVRLPAIITTPPLHGLLPDLTVTIDTLTRNPSRDWGDPGAGFVYQSFNIPFTITNRGTANSPIMTRRSRGPCWELSYYVPIDRSPYRRGWVLGAQGDCNQIEPGGSHPDRGLEDFQMPDFVTRIRVTVDPDRRITESNEANNQDEKVITR